VFGSSVTFSAVVGDAVSGVPLTGAVQFFDGTTLIGTNSLDATTNTATFTTSTLSTGAHVITAQYQGDIDTLLSTSQPLTQTVQKVYNHNESITITTTNANSTD
jgi:hypothetical protein